METKQEPLPKFGMKTLLPEQYRSISRHILREHGHNEEIISIGDIMEIEDRLKHAGI